MDASLFTFGDGCADRPARPVLSLSLRSGSGALLRDQRVTQTRLPPHFSNLLPEGFLRTDLTERAGVKPVREFYLLRSSRPPITLRCRSAVCWFGGAGAPVRGR